MRAEIIFHFQIDDLDPDLSCLVSPVGKVPVFHVGGLGSIPGQTNTQGLKTIEEKVLPLL